MLCFSHLQLPSMVLSHFGRCTSSGGGGSDCRSPQERLNKKNQCYSQNSFFASIFAIRDNNHLSYHTYERALGPKKTYKKEFLGFNQVNLIFVWFFRWNFISVERTKKIRFRRRSLPAGTATSLPAYLPHTRRHTARPGYIPPAGTGLRHRLPGQTRPWDRSQGRAILPR